MINHDSFSMLELGNAWTPERFWLVQVVGSGSAREKELLVAGWIKRQATESEWKRLVTGGTICLGDIADKFN